MLHRPNYKIIQLEVLSDLPTSQNWKSPHKTDPHAPLEGLETQ